MIKKLIFGTAIFLSVLSATSCSTQKAEQAKVAQNNPEMFLENESKYNFDETIAKLTEQIEKKNWKVATVHDLQKSLEKSNIKVLPIKVLALCQPEYASEILLKDDERIVSALMPCRVSVYEKSNGKTYISRMNAEMMPPTMSETIKKVMGAATNDVEEIINTVVVSK